MEPGIPMEIDDSQINKQKKHSFMTVEKLFRDSLSKKLSNRPHLERESLICCSDEDETVLMTMGDRIHQIPPYDTLSFYDIYLTMIFIYYTLLGEQTEDYFTIAFFNKYANDKKLVQDLYLKLTTGDIIEPTSGTNLSSFVRQTFFGLTPTHIGGKKEPTLKKIRTRKRNAKRNKSPRRQTNKKHKRTRK